MHSLGTRERAGAHWQAPHPFLAQQHVLLIHPPMTCRFKQLRAVLLTDSPAVAAAGGLAGCYAVQQLGSSGSGSVVGSPAAAAAAAAVDLAQPPATLAAQLCRLLQVKPLPPPGAAQAAPALAAVLAAAAAGSQGGQQADDSEEGDEVIDMLLLCVDAATLAGGADGSAAGAAVADTAAAAVAALEWADDLLRALNLVPGFRQTVLTSLVLGPGQQPLAAQPLLLEDQPLLQPGQPFDPAAVAGAAAAVAAADCPAVRRPLQSYQFLGQQRVAVDGARPALVVHRLPAVVRRASQGVGRAACRAQLCWGRVWAVLASSTPPRVHKPPLTPAPRPDARPPCAPPAGWTALRGST